MSAPRPAHVKAVIHGKTVYACDKHLDRVAPNLQQPVHPSERDSSTVWCSFCEEPK